MVKFIRATESREDTRENAFGRHAQRLTVFDSLNHHRITYQSDVTHSQTHTFTHIDDVLQVIGFGKIQLYIMCSTGFLLMGFVCETMGISILSTLARCNFKLDENDVSNLRIAASTGVVSSSLLWGYICDCYGRRRVLYYCMIVSMLFSISSMFCFNYTIFFMFRFFTGFFIAVASFVALTYMAEFVSPDQRPSVTNYLNVWNGFAMLYVPAFATLLARNEWYYDVSDNFRIEPWRVLGLIYTIPTLIGWLMLQGCPDSPYFKLSVGKMEDALVVLERMAHVNLHKTLHELGIREIGGVQAMGVRKWYTDFSLQQMLYGISFFVLINLFIIILSIFFITQGMNMWFTELRNREGFEYLRDPTAKQFCLSVKTPLPKNEYTHKSSCCDSFLGFNDSLILGAVYILAYIILGLLVWVIPRRMVFVFSLAISGICCLILPTLTKRSSIVIFLVIAVAVPAAVFNLLWSAVMEFMPTRVRGRAVAFCHMVGRFGAILGIKVVTIALAAYCTEIFQFIGSFVIIGAIVSAFTPF